MKKLIFCFFSVLVVLTLTLSSCGLNFKNSIQLPESSALTDVKKFAVILDTYVTVYPEKDTSSKELAYLRRADLVNVLSRERDEKTSSIWLNIQTESVSGWIFNTNVDLYDSKEKALLAIKAVK